MITYKGIGASEGYAIGVLKHLKATTNTNKESFTPEIEYNRYQKAKNNTISRLNDLSEKLKQKNETASELMFAYACYADDPDFNDSISSYIFESKESAENAIIKAGEEFALAFEQMDGDISSRGTDIRDVAKQIVNELTGNDNKVSIDSPVILSSDDLSPSETVSLNKDYLLAFVTNKGSIASHTAILARSYGIPAIVNLESEITDELDGELVIVNGYTGELIVNPDKDTLSHYETLVKEQNNNTLSLEKYRGLTNTTSKGKTVKLYCNIQNPDEVNDVLKNDSNGIGLFRSEFLFLGRNNPPTEEEQFDAYKQVLSAMNDNEVIIRTMDIGADKDVPYLSTKSENNPALGNRGIRLSLSNIQLFKTQLRAIYRASIYGNALIMFPMIANLWEVVKAKEICENVKSELKAEGYEIKENIPVGIMIETPAAALISDTLAKEVDFFSVGTNDLTQYTLACDRVGEGLQKYYDTHHPALLSLLEITINNAHKNSIPVGVCGEIASNEDFIEKLVNMGVDELSVNPKSILRIRKIIREI